MHRVLLVLPDISQGSIHSDELDLGYAHGLISFLVKESNLTVLLASDADVIKCDNYLKRDIGSHGRLISLAEINRLRTQAQSTRLVEDEPFVDQSSKIYEYICQSDYDCVIFDVFEATGFIPIRAKRTGLGLEKTLLVSWLSTCHEFQRNQVLETSDYSSHIIAELELEFAERYCCHYSDLIVTHTDTIFNWVAEQEWNLDPSKVIRLADLRTGNCLRLLLEKLHTVDDSKLLGLANSEKTNPLLSICVAHFNDGRNLQFLLKSVKENDYENFEVIVVDDGSTDVESLEIFDSLTYEYSGDSWRFIRKEKNESLGPTRNFAVNHAKGEFIFFLDSDDLIANTLISDFVRGMLRSGVDCLTCPLVYFEGDGGIPDRESLTKWWLPLGASLEIGIYGDPFGGANFCIKKSVFESLGGFCSPRGEVHEDWEFLARLVLAGFDMDVVPKPLYFYRVRPGSWLHAARSNISVHNLRNRILDSLGPQHLEIVHDLLLRTMAQNDLMRSYAWKLDRKVVKIGLKLADVVSERKRVSIENLTIRILMKLRTVCSGVKRFLSGIDFIHCFASKTNVDIFSLQKYRIDNSLFLVSYMSDSERLEKLNCLGLPLDCQIFGLIGEMNQEKSLLGFLRLAYWMQMSRDDSFFILLGNRSFHDQIRTTVMKYKLENFKWIPFLEKPEDLYSVLSGLVITCQVDKCPVELFEALACGVPVFSTDAGEAGGILQHYGSGVVVSHDPQHKDFADCFEFWKNNLEIYKTAAMETAELIKDKFGV